MALQPITWETYDYGRHGDLTKLNNDRNNPNNPKQQRQAADKAYVRITNQIRDIRLMAMRERLIKASQAGDTVEIKRITQSMRAYNREDQETGLY